MDENKKEKKQAKRECTDILKILIPDQLKRINENSGWCGTVSVKPNDGKVKKPI